MKHVNQYNASVLEQKIKSPVSFRPPFRKGGLFTQSTVAQHSTNEIKEPKNQMQALRRFLGMLADHLTNGKMTAYTFYY